MPTLLEELKQVQPCDDRGLLQILSQRIVQEIIKVKRAACDEVANTLTTYGLEEIYPCDYITEEFLKKLTEGDPVTAISSVLLKAGYPPHLLKIFTKGFDELTTEELQEVIKWTEPITGIQVHKDTAEYFKGEITITTTLESYITQEILTKTRWVEDQTTVLREETEEEAQARVAAEREQEVLDELYKLPHSRMVQLLLGTGPKITEAEWKGSPSAGIAWGTINKAILADFILNYGDHPLIKPNLEKIKKLEGPVEQGGFGYPSFWNTMSTITEDSQIQLSTVKIVAKKQIQETYTETINVEKTREVEVKTKTGALTPEEKAAVEKWYLDQGVGSLTRFLAQALAQEVFSKITCPAPELLNKLVTRIKNLARQVGALREKLTKLSQFLNIASATVRLINNIIDALKAVITVSGPLIIALSVDPITRTIAIILNKVTQVCQKLINRYEPRIEKLDKSLCAAAKGMTFVVANINVVDAFIRILDGLLQKCIEPDSFGDVPDLGLIDQLTPLNYLAQGIAYRGFELEVRVEPSTGRLKRRYAVALDVNKVVMLQGPYSFSADADILIDELKYRIDAYLG